MAVCSTSSVLESGTILTFGTAARSVRATPMNTAVEWTPGNKWWLAIMLQESVLTGSGSTSAVCSLHKNQVSMLV